MKTPSLIKFLPIVLAIGLIFVNIQLANAEVVQIERDFQPDPLILRGESGGFEKSNCGNIDTKPDRILEITESLPYLRLTVESQGKPTLLIDGPEGRFCVLADTYSQDKPEISGYWPSGKYLLHIGELSQGQYKYTLSISQQKIPQK
jgi:hypothetical protein